MNATHRLTPARAAHAARLAVIAKHEFVVAEHVQLRMRFHGDITAAQARLAAYEQERASHRELLGAFALGEVSQEQLDEQRKHMAAADADAARLRQGIEIAEAGIERLNRTLEPIHAAITSAKVDLPALEHAARVEHAQEYVPAYVAAVNTFAEAHAALTGACLFADEMVEQLPPQQRRWVGRALQGPSLEVPLPMLPGLDPSVKLDLTAATEKARQAAAEKFVASAV